ncbi:MAG: hypothetical protein QXP01_09610, partial [Candidatus Hadarchaeum sp.]
AYEITIPSKTYAYLASGRPILVGAVGDVADLIRELNAGLVVPPEEPAALASAVREFYEMPATQRESYGHNAAQAYAEHFDRQVLIRRYEAIFTTAARS